MSTGFFVLAVPRSPNAPHAVRVGDALRFPKRHGRTTRYLSEAEVAAAYRDRFGGARRQAERLAEVESDALKTLESSGPWCVVALAPDLPGEMVVCRESFRAFREQTVNTYPLVGVNDLGFRRARVGRRRLIADGTYDNSPLANWALLDLHADGCGAFAARLPPHPARRRRDRPRRAQRDPQPPIVTAMTAEQPVCATVATQR